MSKYNLLLLLSALSLGVSANNRGAEIQSGIVYSIYQQCNDDANPLAKLAQIMEIPKLQWCGCLISHIQRQFEQSHLEQRLNQGDITLKQFEQEMETVGEKAAEYCVDKLLDQ